MKSIMRLTVALGTLASLSGVSVAAKESSRRGVSAIEKVIQMLNDMQAKAKKEKGDEQIAYAEFEQWCKGETARLGHGIKKSSDAIESLDASVEKLTEESKQLGERIAKLQGEIATHEADMKARKRTREKEHAAYVEESTDYAESISALERAIDVMSSKDYDRSESSAALLQISQNARVSEKAKDIIEAFLDSGDDDDDFKDYAAPEAHAYENQSGHITNMLKRLLDEFRAKKDTNDKEEANAKHAYNMVMMDLSDTVSNAETDVNEMSSTKARHEEKTASDRKQSKATALVKAEDEGTLKDVEAECMEKKMSFDEKQQLRSDEIEAIEEATKIMASPEVSSSFIQIAAVIERRTAASALAQLRSESHNKKRHREKQRHDVHKFIERESRRLNSHALSMLAQSIVADPFGKVKVLISNMVQKLLKEANLDADHEGFCDTEMGKNKVTRTALTEDIDAVTASLDEAKAEIMELSESNTQLANDIKDINKARTDATAMRTAESKKNEETVEDAEAAIKAVDAATAVLKDFYKKASTATA
jgi:hypothetical protein